MRAAGMVPDDQAVGDLAAASRLLRAQPTSNGKVGVIGTCSVAGTRSWLPHASRANSMRLTFGAAEW